MKSVFALMLTAALLLGVSAAAEKRKVEPLLLSMPLYNQHDYADPVFAWNEQEVTVEESGCGAACVAMVVGYFEPDDAPEPDDVMSLAGELGLYRGDGLGRDALRLLLDEYGSRGAGARWTRGRLRTRCERAIRLLNTSAKDILRKTDITSSFAASRRMGNYWSPIQTARKRRRRRRIALPR